MSVRYRLLDAALGRGALPDPLLRAGSRLGARARERREGRGGLPDQDQRLRELLERMRSGPIAEQTASANEQHYELPSDFFGLILGPRRKYSGCLWDGAGTLAEAEEAMLALTCERAEVRDGMRLLDLGCGWGSLTLWLAERYRNAEIVAVSNSSSQRAYIEGVCENRGFANVQVLTADVNEFEPPGGFDRVISVEMFEHMRNWHELLARISRWLTDDGKLFVHVFSHRTLPYLFEGTWAAERFFTAGLMPSHELLALFQDDLVLEQRWAVPGTHYARTLDAWLHRLDDHTEAALGVFRGMGLSERQARARLGQWRLFLLSTSEIWRWRSGERWLVSHYLLSRRGGNGRNPDVRAM